jgi:mono/diheme cytochrome c family protein
LCLGRPWTPEREARQGVCYDEKVMSRNGFLVSAACAGMALLYAASGSSAQDAEAGERIMNSACQDCHDTRRIQTAAMDAAGWTRTVNTMIEKGAKVSKEDLPVLVNYLAFSHGPIPDGPGKEIVLNTCTMCHDLKRIKLGPRSPEEWEETLISMLNEGAPLSDEQFARVHAYLSRNFGVE